MTPVQKTVKAIKKFNRFLITSHINLEGDSLGSQLAMALLLKCLGKEFVIVDHDKVPAHYRFLPGARLVKNKPGPGNKKIDAAIVLDCPNLRRTGRVKNYIKKAPYIINIDHHISNDKFGNVNWVEKDASSVGEMIHKLYKSFRCDISKEAALYMYISILTDTGSFNYSNTSGATHGIVSELLSCGIEPHSVSRSIYENKNVGDIKLLEKALSRLSVTCDGKIAYMSVLKKEFARTKTKPSSCENFINFARSIKGMHVAIMFREDMKNKNVFHVSFRSSGKADVNKIASFFGGGGHKNASGCTVRGSLPHVKKTVLNKVRNVLK